MASYTTTSTTLATITTATTTIATLDIRQQPTTTTTSSNSSFMQNSNIISGNINESGNAARLRYGRCKWFNVEKGWGFITPLDGGVDVFVHQSVIQMSGFRSLGEQEEVEFKCQLTERGMEATHVNGLLGVDCHGSTYRPRQKRRFVRRVRCYNCGQFANHLAEECPIAPQPKRCYNCRGLGHVFANCPQRVPDNAQNEW